jgi:hypothetical protein
MNELNVTSNRTITFLRNNNADIYAYLVTVTENDNGVENTYSLPLVLNPDVPNLMLKTVDIVVDDTININVPADIFVDNSHDMTLYINGLPVSPLDYEYNSALNQIRVHTPLTLSEVVELEYYRDEMVVYHNTTMPCTYVVSPIYGKTNNLGDHNLLLKG